MPTYQYLCTICNHEFEEILKISDMDNPTLNTCPQCNKRGNIVKLISNTSIGDPIKLGFTKPNSTFRERMRHISKKHPNNLMRLR